MVEVKDLGTVALVSMLAFCEFDYLCMFDRVPPMRQIWLGAGILSAILIALKYLLDSKFCHQLFGMGNI